MKKIIHLIVFLCASQMLFAQLPNGSVAPNFIGTDLDGNEWELYELLDQGKTVILDISATWCAPCWDYHQSGELETLWEEHGPNATDEFFVFLIEGDEGTTVDDLYGTGGNTLGNWVDGVGYPIIDDRDIAEAFKINFFPTIFMICPTRTTYQISQATATEIYDASNICPAASGQNNASILSYGGLEGSFCDNVHFAPSVLIQNMGTMPLTSATINLTVDNVPTETINWTGNLNTYQVGEVVFDSLFLTGGNELLLEIINTNGTTDDDFSNNVYTANITVSPFSEDAFLELELKLDNAPGAIYWEITDKFGWAYYYGGNRSIQYPNASDEERYTQANGTYTHQIALPEVGCYEFRIYDSFGDGLSAGNGYFQLKKQNGEVLLSGGDFNWEDFQPFGLINHSGTTHNAALLQMDPLPPDFCHSYTFSPFIKIQNIGKDSISNIEIEITGNSTTYLTHTWDITIPPGKIEFVSLPEITVHETDNITVTILSIDGEPDIYDFKNSVTRPVFRRSTTTSNWIIDLYTGNNGHEIYWQLTDDNDAILFSGGNSVVADAGGGMGIATPNDPGAYESNEHLVEEITMPEPGCYHLQILDDGGDGLTGGGFGIPSPYFRIRNNSVGIIAGTNGNFTNTFESNIEVEDPNSIGAATAVAIDFNIFPNPAKVLFYISMETFLEEEISLSIWNPVTGKSLLERKFQPSNSTFLEEISTENLPVGVLLVSMQIGDQVISKKLVIVP